MANNYFDDLVQNIYTNCDMSGFHDYQRGVQNLNKITYQSAKERIKINELEERSRIRLNDYEEKYALRKAKRDEAEIARMHKKNWLWRGAVRLIGTYFGIQTLKNIIRTGTEIQLIQRSITGLTGSAQDWEFLDKAAYKYGLSLKTVATGYKNFYSSAKMAGFQPQQIQGMFADMLLGARAIGASDQQIGGALLALEQMMSKGRVSMEELRRQLGNALPGAFEIGAKAMGVTTAKFNEMVKAGISANEFVPKFIKTFKEQYQNGWKDVEQTVNVAQGRLKESWEKFAFELMHGEAGKELAKGINAIAEFMRTPEFYRFTKLLGQIFGLIVKIFRWAIKNIEFVMTLLGTLGLTRVIVGLNASIELLKVKGVTNIMALVKASALLYGQWLLLFGLLALIQDLIYGLAMPEVTESLTEDLLKHLGLYSDKPSPAVETATERIKGANIEKFKGGVLDKRGNLVYIDENGVTRIIPSSAPGMKNIRDTYDFSGEFPKIPLQSAKKHSIIAPGQIIPQTQAPYLPTELNKTESQTLQTGDIIINVNGSSDPAATGQATVDAFDAWRRKLLPLSGSLYE